MKKLLLLLILPVTAMANPIMGDCKTQYDVAYKVMMMRQSGIPMHELVDAIEAHASDERDIATGAVPPDLLEAKRVVSTLVERAYTMPNFGFMESAAHNMAVEFANQHYLRCTRAQRR